MSSSLLISVVFFCLTGVGAIALYAAFARDRHAFEKRMDALGVQARLVSQGNQDDEEWFEDFARQLSRWVVKRLPQPDRRSSQGERIARSLMQAGFFRPGSIRTFWYTRLALTAGLPIFALLACYIVGDAPGHRLLWLAGAGAMGYAAPGYYVGRRGRARQRQIARQLSDVLDLLVVCVEAGLGLFEAIKIVGTETARRGQAIGEELTFMSAEIAAGSRLGDALRSMAERTAVEDIRPLAATLIQSEQLGAQIAPALRASSDALRARRRLRAEEAAQKASVKILIPLVLFVLPALMAVMLGPAFIQIMRAFGH
jgi:tight adherence protein C